MRRSPPTSTTTRAARAWLNGTSSGEPSVCNSAGVYQAGATDACPAMVVNPAYKGIPLPVDQWPLLSTWESTAFDANPQVQSASRPPRALRYPCSLRPWPSLEDISESMQFHNANSTTTCTPDAPDVPNSLVGRRDQSPGDYFMLGITPLADDARYDLQTAALQTTSRHVRGAEQRLAGGGHQPAPARPTTGTWPIPTTSSRRRLGAAAYPGTLVVYAAVPTSGLPAAGAADYAALLDLRRRSGPDRRGGRRAAAARLPSADRGRRPRRPGRLHGWRRPGRRRPERPDPLPDQRVGGIQRFRILRPRPAPRRSARAPSEATVAFISALFGSAEQRGQRARPRRPPRQQAAKANAAKIPFIRLPGIADTALWIGGVPVGLILTLALLVSLTAVTALFLGRRRRRW